MYVWSKAATERGLVFCLSSSLRILVVIGACLDWKLRHTVARAVWRREEEEVVIREAASMSCLASSRNKEWKGRLDAVQSSHSGYPVLRPGSESKQ